MLSLCSGKCRLLMSMHMPHLGHSVVSSALFYDLPMTMADVHAKLSMLAVVKRILRPSPVCRRSYAQLGAGYGVSNAATATVARAHSETKTFMNAHGVGEVVLGPHTSQLLENLGRCYSSVLGPGDEVSMPATVRAYASARADVRSSIPLSNARPQLLCTDASTSLKIPWSPPVDDLFGLRFVPQGS